MCQGYFMKVSTLGTNFTVSHNCFLVLTLAGNSELCYRNMTEAFLLSFYYSQEDKLYSDHLLNVISHVDELLEDVTAFCWDIFFHVFCLTTLLRICQVFIYVFLCFCILPTAPVDFLVVIPSPLWHRQVFIVAPSCLVDVSPQKLVLYALY